MSLLRRVTGSYLLCICMLAGLTGRCVTAAQWLWQADNHTGNLSYFTDHTAAFTFTRDGDSEWVWDQPTKGALSYRSFRGYMIGSAKAGGVGVSSDFGESLDINKGITLAARVKPTNSHSHGAAICLSVDNSSTPSPVHLWVGWTLSGKIALKTQGKVLREIEPTADYDCKWTIWTLSAKRIGEHVAWDLWIDGAHQAPDQRASDGSAHTLITKDSDTAAEASKGTTVTIGQGESVVDPQDVAWDYVAVTNDGVVPGWEGGSAAAKLVEPDKPAAKERQSYLDLLAIHKKLVEGEALEMARRFEDAVKLCTDALAKYEGKGPDAYSINLRMTWGLRQIKAESLALGGRYMESINYCDELLEKHPDGPPSRLEFLKSYKAMSYEKLGRLDDAAQVIDGMVSTLDATLKAALVVNPSFEEFAPGSAARGWSWYRHRAEASGRLDATNPHSGSHCYVFARSSKYAGDVYARLFQIIDVYPNTKYEISLWVRGEDVGISNEIAGWSGFRVILPSGTYDWTRVSTTFTTKNGEKGINLGLNLVNACKELAIDDIEVRPVQLPAQAMKTVAERKAQMTMQKAEMFYRHSKYREAADAYKEVMDTKETSPDLRAQATYQLALCYEESGLSRSARAYMRRATEKYSDTQWARKARGMLYVWSTYGNTE